jgi:hypothetical protein
MESQEYLDVPDSWPLENEERVDTYLGRYVFPCASRLIKAADTHISMPLFSEYNHVKLL